MSRHSKWATTHRQALLTCAARLPCKVGNQIAVRRGGWSPALNSSLAMAIEKAKACEHASANIQRAIDRWRIRRGGGFGGNCLRRRLRPGGVGVIIETATDNRNPNIARGKNCWLKMADRYDASDVMFQFTRKERHAIESMGKIRCSGFERWRRMLSEDGEIIVYTELKDLASVRNKLVEARLEG